MIWREGISQPKRFNRSRQRSRILELLRGTGRHPTADWVYDQLKGEFPNLSMGTVYRNLSILIEQGLTAKIDFGSTFDRFDANTTPHHHFVCEECGAITDLELPIDHDLDERVKEATQFTVLRHRIEFYGLCETCSAAGDDDEGR